MAALCRFAEVLDPTFAEAFPPGPASLRTSPGIEDFNHRGGHDVVSGDFSVSSPIHPIRTARPGSPGPELAINVSSKGGRDADERDPRLPRSRACKPGRHDRGACTAGAAGGHRPRPSRGPGRTAAGRGRVANRALRSEARARARALGRRCGRREEAPAHPGSRPSGHRHRALGRSRCHGRHRPS
jgi:hypothetical protein